MSETIENTLLARLVNEQNVLKERIKQLAPMSDTEAAQLKEMLQTQLTNVTHALEKIEREDHSFGVCERCKQGISADRMMALPTAKYCHACALSL